MAVDIGGGATRPWYDQAIEEETRRRLAQAAQGGIMWGPGVQPLPTREPWAPQPVDWASPWQIPEEVRVQPEPAPWLPTIMQQWPGREPQPGAVIGRDVTPRLPEPTPLPEGVRPPPGAVIARGAQLPQLPEPTPLPTGVRPPPGAVVARGMEPREAIGKAVGAAAYIWGLTPDPIQKPVEKAVGGILEAFNKAAIAFKKSAGFVTLSTAARPQAGGAVYVPTGAPGDTREVYERRERKAALLREINMTPKQKIDFSDSFYTWMATPELEEQALEEVRAGADALEVAQKYRNDKAELIGELAFDPLVFAPILTKPLTKLIGGAVQGIKKFKPIAPLFELSKRSIVQVARFDAEDIAKVLYKSGDDAKAMAKTLDSFLDDSAKFADQLRPRGAAQAESVADLIKGSGLKGSNVIQKGMTRSEAVEATAQAISKAAAKAVGYNPSAQRTFISGAQQVLVEHWLGTRPAWLVYNYADNSLKLAIEGVGPWFRLGPNLEKHIATYGDVPAQVAAGFSKSITGLSDISMHERVMGLPGKPVTAIMSKGGRMEGVARTRLYIHEFAGLARGGRDDALRLIDDLLGPVDDATRALIARDIRSISHPNAENVYEAVMRYAKKKVPVTSARSFADDAGRIHDEARKVVREGLEKATTPEEVAAVFDNVSTSTVDEATQYVREVGQSGDWTPFNSFDDVGGPSAVFEEGGEELIGFRPDLSHELTGQLAKEVGINPKHARNALKKINRDLGIDEGLLWSAAKTETGGESARLYWNYLWGEGFNKDIELPSWIVPVELIEPAEDIAWVTQKLAAAQEAGDTERVASLERQLYMATQRAEGVRPPAAAVPEAAPTVAQFAPADDAERIAQPILDEFANWRTSATDDLARAGETIEQSPEALRAIRNYADEAKKMMRSTLDDAPIKASLKVNKALGNYTERNVLSGWMHDLVTFWDWPAYNIPYWARTFALKPMIPATAAKARAFQAAANEGLPARLQYSTRLPIPSELLEKVGFAPDSALYADFYRYMSFMQQIPGGTPYQASNLKEAMDDPTSPESIWTIGSQMGYRTWPWNETVLGAAGVLGDDWYPFDLSSYESIARAVFDTDMTPSSWWREKMGLEPNKFLEWQTQKEVRAQIVRGEEANWDTAREKARNKGGFLALMAILGLPVKEFTAEEDERMGMSAELREAVKADVERTGGDPTTMGSQEMWTWAKRHGATMKDEKSAINDFYEANPDYPDLPWETEEEWQVEQDRSAYFDEGEAARAERDGRIADLAIPHDRDALNQIWGDYFDDITAINAKYPNASITPSTDRPIEYLKDQTQQALLRQLDETKPDYYATVGEVEEGERVYKTYEEYSSAVREWEAGLRATALELWGAETLSNFPHLATPEAVEEYDKSHHTIASAAHYTWKKHIESPFWEEAQWAQVSQLAGEADWENVAERISQWSDLIEAAAEPAEIDPRIVATMIDVESGGNPEAYNSRSQATGLMQVIPGEVFEGRPSSDELLDPATNIEAGIDILVEYLAGADYDLKDALYEYSGGSAWSSKEAYEKQYWDRLSAKFKGLWGVSLGSLRADARDTVMTRPMEMDVDSLLPLIMMEYPGRWTPDEIRAELGGQTIMGVIEAQEVQRPDTAAAREEGNDVWDTRTALPPGVYRKAIDALPEVSAFLSTGENPKAALEAIEVYTDEHVPQGTPQEWATAEREHDEFRRWVYNEPGLGASIYEEQSAYFAAREEGRRVEPSERLQTYWDAHDQFRQEHPLYTKYYSPAWQPREDGGGQRGVGAPRGRAPTKEEQREAEAVTWNDFAASFTGGADLLELIQSWLLLDASQREWFLAGNPELAAWLRTQDPELLGQLRASLGAAEPQRRGYDDRPWTPNLRWYRSW